MNSGNPIFSRLSKQQNSIVRDASVATYKGIALKTLILFIVTVAAAVSVPFLAQIAPNLVITLISVASIVSFIAVIVGTMSVEMAPSMSIVYAVFQGLLLGLISWLLEGLVQNIVISALTGTAVIFIVMMVLYYTGVVKTSTRLRKVLLGSLIAIIISSLILSIVNIQTGILNQNFGLQIVVSAVMIILGAIMLMFDFERADTIVASQLPKAYEWQVSLGFMITLVWIYVEMLRLLTVIAMRSKD